MSRTPEEFIRIYGTPERQAWMRSGKCLVADCPTNRGRRPPWTPDGRKLREICHTANGGTGRKGDADVTVTMCWVHHDLSAAGRRTFEKAHILEVRGVRVYTLREAATETNTQWEAEKDG
jgi:hypothetical protein